MLDITSSIVIYKNEKRKIDKLVTSLLNTRLNKKTYIIDNSPYPQINKLWQNNQIVYLHNQANLGYGRAHNIAIKESINISKYHLILNPDITLVASTIEKIYRYMEENRDVGLLMPKILFPDGSLQYLAKLLPTPFDLLFRRFLPFSRIKEKRNEMYELRFTGYNKIMNVPYLSGCFMFLRIEALKKVGFFDERFFMYLEDTDLSRRIHKYYKTVYYPNAIAYHEYQKGSYKNLKLLFYHISSAIKYFNKWGWFFDKERKEINKKTLKKLGYRKIKVN